MNFYKHYLGDYARDTKGLSVTEHGAYRLLLDHCYATEQPLPPTISELYRIVGAMTTAERKAVDKVAERFFPVNGDGSRHNKRAEEEIQKHFGQVQANRIVAEERERKRRGGRSLDDQSTNRSTNDQPNHSQKPEETKASEANASEVPVPGTKLPACPHAQIVALYHEILPMCQQVIDWTPGRQSFLRSRWRERAIPSGGNKGYATVEEGLAHWRRFFRWVAESRFLTGKENGRHGLPPFVADLEWLIRPTNFVKVIEGQYHR